MTITKESPQIVSIHVSGLMVFVSSVSGKTGGAARILRRDPAFPLDFLKRDD